MHRFYKVIPVLVVFAMAVPVANAQMMGGAQGANMMNAASGTAVTSSADTAATAQDEAAGKAIWEKLQNKTTACADLKDDDFDVLGDYFMGNMMGGSHAQMNAVMKSRLGDDGEKQMHIAMGKRLSGCDTSAAFPAGSENLMPMMGGRTNGAGTVSARGGDWGGAGMMGNSFDGEQGRGHDGAEGALKVFGFVLGLSALAFFTTGSMFYWKKTHKHDCKNHGDAVQK